jgi:Spy/CpxP family protein refolding chaperone
MIVTRFRATFASVLLLAACDRSPTAPLDDQALLDSVDPVVLTFDATQGLPGMPFVADGGPPMIAGPMTAMPMTGFARGMGRHGPGAPLPDSLRLTEAQRNAIRALVEAFHAANAADLAALRTIHQQVRDAIRAGKSREEIRAIAQRAEPILERLRPAMQALHAAIWAVLTPAQRAWIEAHRPERPPRTP